MNRHFGELWLVVPTDPRGGWDCVTSGPVPSGWDGLRLKAVTSNVAMEVRCRTK